MTSHAKVTGFAALIAFSLALAGCSEPATPTISQRCSDYHASLPVSSAPRPEIAPSEFIAKMKDNRSINLLLLPETIGIVTINPLADRTNLVAVKNKLLDTLLSQADTYALIECVRAIDSNIEFIEPNYVNTIAANDPSSSGQVNR